MNRVLTIFIIIFLVNISKSIAHDVPQYTIKERTENANIIFEGEVLSSTSMWSENRRLIYTKHEVKIEKLFKGIWRETTITIYTKGGEAEGEIHMHSHDASLNIGFKGIFFGITNPYRNIKDENFTGVRLLYESGGFIRYTGNNVGIKASDHYRGFKSISAVHDSIVISTRQPILKYENGILPDFSLAPCPPLAETRLGFSFENIELTNLGQFVEFDIFGATNMNGLQLDGFDFDLKYPTEVFGENVVQNGLVEITKGEIIQAPIYNLQKLDLSENTFRIKTTSSISQSSEPYAMTTVKEKLVHVKLDISNIFALANTTGEDFQSEGNASFYCGLSSHPFDNININDIVKIKAPKSADVVGITFTFENLEIIDGGIRLK